jgi:glycosyltransferase involved in cell wall biosynthesis
MDFAGGLVASRRSAHKALRVMHGKPGHNRGTAELASALDSLEESGIPVLVACLGSVESLADAVGDRRASHLLDPRRLARFELHDLRPHAEMPALMAECHVGALGYTGDEAYASFPNRLFEYMAAGLPVVGPRESPFVARTITRHSCGLTFSNLDPGSLANAISALALDPGAARRMGQSGRDAFERELTWERQSARTFEILEMTAQPR